MKRLSIIIPGYNTPDCLWRRSIDSAISAIGDDDEIICIDDGSKNPAACLREYEERDHRVRVLRVSENKGQSAARNLALRVATGRWVTFLDSDDAVYPEIYDRCLSGNLDADVIVFGVRTIWQREKMTRVDSLADADLGILSANTIRMLYDSRLFEYVWNKVYRRAFIDENKVRFAENLCPGEDTVFNLDCALQNARWRVVKDVGYKYYRMDGTSLSRYLPERAASLRRKAELWKSFSRKFGDEEEKLTKLARFSDSDARAVEWDNMWRGGSPYNMMDRWRFVRKHRVVLNVVPIIEYLKKIIYTFVRRYFYFSWVYKIHISRYYCDLHSYKPERNA